MKNRNTYFIALTVLLALSFYSCNKEGEGQIQKNEPSDERTWIEGREGYYRIVDNFLILQDSVGSLFFNEHDQKIHFIKYEWNRETGMPIKISTDQIIVPVNPKDKNFGYFRFGEDDLSSPWRSFDVLNRQLHLDSDNYYAYSDDQNYYNCDNGLEAFKDTSWYGTWFVFYEMTDHRRDPTVIYTKDLVKITFTRFDNVSWDTLIIRNQHYSEKFSYFYGSYNNRSVKVKVNIVKLSSRYYLCPKVVEII